MLLHTWSCQSRDLSSWLLFKCISGLYLRGCNSPASVLMSKELYLQGGYRKEGCVCLELGSCTMAPNPLALLWWSSGGGSRSGLVRPNNKRNCLFL